MAKNSKHGFGLRRILAKNIRQLRKLRGLSQEGFADICGLHRTYIGSVEREERNVTLSSLDAFAKALKISAADLIREIKDAKPSSGRKNKT